MIPFFFFGRWNFNLFYLEYLESSWCFGSFFLKTIVSFFFKTTVGEKKHRRFFFVDLWWVSNLGVNNISYHFRFGVSIYSHIFTLGEAACKNVSAPWLKVQEFGALAMAATMNVRQAGLWIGETSGESRKQVSISKVEIGSRILIIYIYIYVYTYIYIYLYHLFLKLFVVLKYILFVVRVELWVVHTFV